jgi:hypothetical protein
VLRDVEYKANAAINGKGLVHGALASAAFGNTTDLVSGVVALKAAAARRAVQQLNATLAPLAAVRDVLTQQNLLGMAIASPIAAYDAAFKAANGTAAALKASAAAAARNASAKVYDALVVTDAVTGKAIDLADNATYKLSKAWEAKSKAAQGAVKQAQQAANETLGDVIAVHDTLSKQDLLGVAIAAPIAAYDTALKAANATRFNVAALKAAMRQQAGNFLASKANTTLGKGLAGVGKGLALAQFGAEAVHGSIYDNVDTHLFKRPLLNSTAFKPALGNGTLFKPGGVIGAPAAGLRLRVGGEAMHSSRPKQQAHSLCGTC